MPPNSPQPQKRKGFFSRPLVLGCCLTPVLLISVMFVGVGVWWTLWNWQLKQKLSDEIQQVSLKHTIVKELQPLDKIVADREKTRQVLVNFIAREY